MPRAVRTDCIGTAPGMRGCVGPGRRVIGMEPVVTTAEAAKALAYRAGKHSRLISCTAVDGNPRRRTRRPARMIVRVQDS